MMWADRTAIGLIGIGATGLFLFLLIAIFVPGFYDLSAPEQIGRAIGWFVGLAIFITLPLWLVLRIIDWVVGGPPRRRRGIQS